MGAIFHLMSLALFPLFLCLFLCTLLLLLRHCHCFLSLCLFEFPSPRLLSSLSLCPPGELYGLQRRLPQSKYLKMGNRFKAANIESAELWPFWQRPVSGPQHAAVEPSRAPLICVFDSHSSRTRTWTTLSTAATHDTSEWCWEMDVWS